MSDSVRTYEYLTCSGVARTVKADSVEFTAHHVVFWDRRALTPVIVLAEKVEDVRRLTDVTPRIDGRSPYPADGALK